MKSIEEVRQMPENQRVIVSVVRFNGKTEEVGFRTPRRLEVEQAVTSAEKVGHLAALDTVLKQCCLTHTPQQLNDISDEKDITAVFAELMALRNQGVELEKKA